MYIWASHICDNSFAFFSKLSLRFLHFSWIERLEPFGIRFLDDAVGKDPVAILEEARDDK